MSGPGGFSKAFSSNGKYDSTRGASIGRNDNSVATAKDGSDFSSFLGPLPPFSGRQRADEAFSRETWDMPDKYADEVQFLNHVLDFFIIDKAEFWCSVILPWKKTDSLHFAWNVWKFDRTIADIEPHQGVPRLVTSSRQSRSSSLIRRGLAFMIEHGFYNTDQGRETFALNLKQITDAVHTTCYSDVLHSLLQCNAYYKEWNTKFGPTHGRQSDVMAQERRRWSIVSKSARGLYLLDADLKREFRREGVNPTAWVWPDRMSVYLHMNHDSETVYNQRGPGAHEALASGNVPASFRGLPVYTSYPIDTDFNGAPISLLERDRMCGEYFYICEDEEIAIFSAEHDKFITITYDQAAKKDVRFQSGADGNNNGTLAKLNRPGDPSATKISDFTAYTGSKPPILIFRPFQTWTMASCILMKAGSELGNTFHGHHDMQLQNDAIRKIMVGHYTFYSRAVVKNEKLVSVVEDVMANDYVAGEGVRFFTAESFSKRWADQEIGRKEMSESLIAFSVDMTEEQIHELPDAIDLLGDFPEAQEGSIAESTKMFKEVDQLESILGLGSLRPMRNAEGNLFLKSMMPLNTVCFRGHTNRKKAPTKAVPNPQFKVTQNGRGHWGANIYPGVAAHRTGLSGDGFIQQMTGGWQKDF